MHQPSQTVYTYPLQLNDTEATLGQMQSGNRSKGKKPDISSKQTHQYREFALDGSVTSVSLHTAVTVKKNLEISGSSLV